MINILVHGLGQNESSWNKVKELLKENKIEVETPNLFNLAKNYQLNYENLYRIFVNYCNSFKEKLNIVGLSLGGILAIDYANEYPEKVNSIILSGTPYEIPKSIITIQNIIYKFMPKKVFEQIGCTKKDLITLMDSIKNLTIPQKAPNIKCHTLIMCGEKEKNNINMKSAIKLNEVIKNSKFEIIKNAGHEVNIDNPKEFANTIYNFWKEN
ncbi:MAG TPA: alpha/beta hydrolase [Clostridiales bacterium]|jgi:pimeloyl-ACP methyl ester carboxylesterase|nr:alpha/beta hydrolase [Clostridiales bacterium]